MSFTHNNKKDFLIGFSKKKEDKNCGGQFYFFAPINEGARVTLHGITDKEVLLGVNQIFSRKFFQTEKMKKLNIVIYPLPKIADEIVPHSDEREILNIKMEKN